MTPDEKLAIAVALNVSNPVVLNIGAHCGEDEQEFAGLVMPSQQMMHVMIEPDPINCAVIRQRDLDTHRRLIEGAIASERGRQTFHRSIDGRDGCRGSGSLLTPTGHLRDFVTIKFWEDMEVECYPLDEIYEMLALTKVDLLWIDVQGAERQVIESGQKTFANSRYCFMEAMDNDDQYEGQANKQTLIAMLPRWTLVQDFDYNIFLRNEALCAGKS